MTPSRLKGMRSCGGVVRRQLGLMRPPLTSRYHGLTSTLNRVSSASAPSPAGPPQPGSRQRLRARWADRHALPRFGFWLLSRGVIVLGACGVLYVLDGFLSAGQTPMT